MGKLERHGRQFDNRSQYRASVPHPLRKELPKVHETQACFIEFQRLPPDHAFIMEDLHEPLFIPVCDMIHKDPKTGLEKHYGYVIVDESGNRIVHSGIYVVNFRVNHKDAIDWLMLHFEEIHHIDPMTITYLDEDKTDFSPFGHLHPVPPQKIPVWNNVSF